MKVMQLKSPTMCVGKLRVKESSWNNIFDKMIVDKIT